MTDDSRIQRLIRRAVHKAIDKVDLTQTSALMLESLTRNNRHQKLLDTLITQLIALLQRESTRTFIARRGALAGDRPSVEGESAAERVAGEQSAALVSDAVNSLLDDINADRTHQIRQRSIARR